MPFKIIMVKIISFNSKWFFDENSLKKPMGKMIETMKSKINIIVSHFKDIVPDILAFQEVEGYDSTKQFVEAGGNKKDDAHINGMNNTNKNYSIVLFELAQEFNKYFKSKNINDFYVYGIGNMDMSGQRCGFLINKNKITVTEIYYFKTKCGLKHLCVDFKTRDYDKTFTIVNIHLKSKLFNNDEKRLLQSKEVRNILKHCESDHKIVCGDFNMMDDDLGIDDLDIDCYKVIKDYQVGGKRELVNCWELVKGTAGTHFYDKNRNKYINKGELSIIDAFLISENLREHFLKIQTTIDLSGYHQNINDKKTKKENKFEWVSDHIPVLLELKFAKIKN